MPGIEVSPREAPPLSFSSVVTDSREAAAGSLFVALRGARDGHAFIADARARGAIGALGDQLLADVCLGSLPDGQARPFVYFRASGAVHDAMGALQQLASYWRDQHSGTIVAVTGSVGKTTTKEVIAAVLRDRRRVLESERSYNSEIGLPLTLLRLEPTHEVAVLEMGMYSLGEIASLCRLARPTVGVVTNVGPVHLERLGTIERIAQAKAELVEALPASGVAVLFGDDRRVLALRERTPARVVTFGLNPDNDVWATDIRTHGLGGITFTLHARGEVAAAAAPRLGKHVVFACLAATAVGQELGLSLADCAAAMANLPPTGSRLVLRHGPRGSLILDDSYNASPASVRAALDVLADLPGRRIAILGDMLELGSEERAGHEEVGRYAARVVDQLIAVGPRARLIGETAEQNGLRSVTYAAGPAEVAVSRDFPGPGDVVLVKGSRALQLETLVARLVC
ncbi:MAG: UDP-N-acetylmuramoyl-tripeptide--D-alanyl-D-alanine ligase [Chloroflexi bacterium]|nr:UDP-N-acetylmuramoyl-tripeptide--D-alanyl-D-alanine ligase [Chloroflexota bacterium]